MKKLILLASTIFIFSYSAFSQEVKDANYYLLKSKNQKTVAWVCLGGGVAIITTAALIGGSKAAGDYVNIITGGEPENNYATENVLLIIGATAMAASIPLFISASKNKMRAKFKVTAQKTALGLPISAPKKIPSLTLSITI